MTTAPFIQIHCQPAPDVQVGGRTIQGLLISPEDATQLRSLEDGAAIISLACPGRTALHVRVAALLKRMVPAPFSDDWYISMTATGPLFTKDK